MSHETILHALDLATIEQWEEAKSLLEPLVDPIAGRLFLLVSEAERKERARKRGISLMRHEIGNALSIAQANVEGMMDGVLDVTRSRFEGIHEALVTAGTLLDDMKRAPAEAPVPPVRIQRFNICALISAQYATIAGLASSKNVSVRYDPCGMNHAECRDFAGDPVRVAQVLRNVLINAVRYSRPGGAIELHCDKPGAHLALTVRDSGPGIAPDEAARVFDEGYRGKNASGEGSGIGLNVVANLLRALGGDARVVNEERHGATFMLTLPVRDF